MNRPPIGILGGTFDPVHNGHLYIARRLLKAIRFDHVRFIPCKNPVHKNTPTATAEDRARMITLALAHEAKCILDRREIDRKTPSYMITTLKSLRADFPDKSLCLISGLDVYMGMATWKDWQDIIHHCHIIITNRPKFKLANAPEMQHYYHQHQTKKMTDLYQSKSGLIYFPDMKPSPISATQLRHAIHAGKPITDKIPEVVAEYIKENRLYLM